MADFTNGLPKTLPFILSWLKNTIGTIKCFLKESKY